MFEELNILCKTHTWDLVDMPLGKTTVDPQLQDPSCRIRFYMRVKNLL